VQQVGVGGGQEVFEEPRGHGRGRGPVGDDLEVALGAVGGGVEERGDEGLRGFVGFEDEEEVPARVVEFGDLDLLGLNDPADGFGEG